MTADLEPQSPVVRWARRAAIFSAVLFVISGAGHRFGAVDTVAFFWLLALVAALAACAIGLAFWSFLRIWELGERGTASGIVALIVALCVLAPFVLSGARMVIYPKLTDISTDAADPPRFTRAGTLRGPGTNPIAMIGPEEAALQKQNYPEVTGRRYEHSSEAVADAVRALVAERNWDFVRRTSQPGASRTTIEAVAKSFFLGFPADVAIRIEGNQESAYVDMRSVSRYADHDLGDNARRVARFLADLDARMTAMTGL